MRELCAWLDLEYEPALLEIPVVNSSYATTGAGVSSEPVERWRERLSPAEVGIVQSVCEPLLSELGYAPDDVHVSPSGSAGPGRPCRSPPPAPRSSTGSASARRRSTCARAPRRRFSRGPL